MPGTFPYLSRYCQAAPCTPADKQHCCNTTQSFKLGPSCEQMGNTTRLPLKKDWKIMTDEQTCLDAHKQLGHTGEYKVTSSLRQESHAPPGCITRNNVDTMWNKDPAPGSGYGQAGSRLCSANPGPRQSFKTHTQNLKRRNLPTGLLFTNF